MFYRHTSNETTGQTHTRYQLRYFKYHENVVFSHSCLRHFRRERSGGTCAHSEECGEEHRDYGEERRAQHGEGHKKSRAHCSQYVHSVSRGILDCVESVSCRAPTFCAPTSPRTSQLDPGFGVELLTRSWLATTTAKPTSE